MVTLRILLLSAAVTASASQSSLLRGLLSAPQQCTNWKTGEKFNVDDKMIRNNQCPSDSTKSRHKCEDVANKPRSDVKCRVDGKAMICPMCKCGWKYSSSGLKYAGWTRDGEETFVDMEEMSSQFLGNVVGHAKMLCQIVQSMNCWKKGNTFSQTAVNETDDLIKITNMDGEEAYVHASNVMDTVEAICGVIDGGLEKLPELLPGLIGGLIPGNLPGIPDLLRKVIGFFGGGGNPFKRIGDFFRNPFQGIFSADGSCGTIRMYSTQVQAQAQMNLGMPVTAVKLP